MPDGPLNTCQEKLKEHTRSCPTEGPSFQKAIAHGGPIESFEKKKNYLKSKEEESEGSFDTCGKREKEDGRRTEG